MLDLSGVPMLDVVIGLAFMYFLLSVVCSAIGEAIASALKLRAANLEVALRAMLANAVREGKAKSEVDREEELIKAFFADPRVAGLDKPQGRLMRWSGWLRNVLGGKANGPSYIAPATAARVLLDHLPAIEPPTPAAPAAPASAPVEEPPVEDPFTVLQAHVDGLPKGAVKAWLSRSVQEADATFATAQKALEDGFNEVMDRATGWYKRRMQTILFVIALAVAFGLNADTFNVADRLARDDALRARVVAEAQQAAQTGSTTAPATTTTETTSQAETSTTAGATTTSTTPTVEDSVEEVRKRIDAARATALPLGWNGENKPKDDLGWVVKLLGLVVTAFALTLGAPFWFDLLGRFASLRGTGNRIGTPKEDNLAPDDRDARPVARAIVKG